jgi:RNA polymerase sigma-70 factor (ECF subfamily)
MESLHQETVNNFVPDEATLAALRFQVLYRENSVTEETSRQLVEYTLPQLNYALRGLLRSNQDLAEDIIQQTYERAFKALYKGKFKGKSQVGTWLYRIMLNSLSTHFHKESNRDDLVLPLDEYVGMEMVDSVDVEEEAMALVLAKRIDQIIVNLNISDQDRKVWYMVIKENRKYAEVALITGLSVGLLKVIIHRIRKKVRTALAE